MAYRISLIVIVTFLLIPSTGLSQPAADYKEDEEILTKAGLKADGADLIEFFRKRTLSDAEVKRLAQLIPQMGDDDFSKRQKASDDLAAAGPPLLPYLRAALNDSDQEVHRRVQECINSIENGPGAARAVAAARMMQAKRPKDACATLLAFLPFADDDIVKEAVMSSLLSLGTRDGKVEEALVSALNDKIPCKRAAAALVTGRSGTGPQRKIVEGLFGDTSPEVRLAAAQGLAAARIKLGAPVLISLLTDAPAAIAEQAEDLLQRMAGEKSPTLSWDEAKRETCHNAWEAWWKSENEKLDLTKADVDPLTRSPVNQTRKLAQSFMGGLFQGKTVDFTKITEFPFYLAENQPFQSHEELNRMLTEEAKGMAQQNVQFEIKATMPVSEYAKRADANTKYLEKLDRRQVYASVMEIKSGSEEGGGFAVFVRIRGGKAKVIGIVEADEGGKK